MTCGGIVVTIVSAISRTYLGDSNLPSEEENRAVFGSLQ